MRGGIKGDTRGGFGGDASRVQRGRAGRAQRVWRVTRAVTLEITRRLKQRRLHAKTFKDPEEEQGREERKKKSDQGDVLYVGSCTHSTVGESIRCLPRLSRRSTGAMLLRPRHGLQV